MVVLESDTRERDAQGNLLRYVWREGRMVNVTMVQLGLATVSKDVVGLNYSDDLLEAQARAQNAQSGLWGPPPTSTLTPFIVTATLTTTQVLTATPVVTPTSIITLTQTPLP
jgi:endonuclease YncB( thermonuclease family)